MTYLLLFIVDHIPGLKLRSTEEAEILGIDETELGETGYDFVYLSRDLESPEEYNEWKAGAATAANSTQGSVHSAQSEKKVDQTTAGIV